MSPTADLVSYLSGKGIQTYKAAGAEVTAHCWFCPDGDMKGKGKLYLNTDTWLWSCKRCTTSGNRKTLLEHFGDQDDAPVYLAGTDPMLRRKVLTEAMELGVDMLYNNPKVLDYLTERGLDPQTIVDAKIGYAPASWGLASILRKTNDFRDIKGTGLVTAEGQEFFSGHILIPYLSHGQPVQIRGRAYSPNKELTGAKYVTPPGESVRLFNADSLQGARYAIVVEGEFDALRLEQELKRSSEAYIRDMSVVGVSGVDALPEGFASYFSECSRVYIGFDPDAAGQRGAAKVKTILGSKSRLLSLPDSLPECDWTDYLNPKTEKNPHGGHTWRDVAELISKADAEGRTLVTPRDALRELRRIEKEVGGVLTGIGGFDVHMSGGLKPGQLFIPIARTGVGKTSFIASLTYNMRARPTLIFSLEMTASEYMNRLVKVARFHDPNVSDDEIVAMYSKVRIFDRRWAPGETMRLCEEFADDVGEDPQVVFLDYLGYAAKRAKGGNLYEKTSNCVQDVKEDAKEGSFVMIAPHQAGRRAKGGAVVEAEDSRDSGSVEDTADVMSGLYRPSESVEGVPFDGSTNLNIVKNRNGRTGVVVPLIFSLASNVMVSKNSPEGLVAADENRLIMTGHTYEYVLKSRQQQTRTVPLWEAPKVVGGADLRVVD